MKYSCCRFGVGRDGASPVSTEELFSCACCFQLQAGVGRQFGGFVGCFPGEIGVAAAEVSVGCSLTVNRTAQVERFYNLARLELEVCPHQIWNQLRINLLGS